MDIKKISGATIDSLILTVVKLLSILIGIISTMIISKLLSLETYGTYVQTNLIVNFASSLTILGMGDAINYFYNKQIENKNKKEYIETILGIQTIIGILCGLILLIFQKNIIEYFDNKFLTGLFIYISFRPLLLNITFSLQILHISIGNAKMIAIRNGIFSIIKLSAISLTAFWLKDIKIILISFLILDIVTVVYFGWSFICKNYFINPFKIKFRLLNNVLNFSIPMGIYIMTNTIAKDIDKLLIGKLENTEMFAVYSNCSTLLPFDIMTSSFLTIIIPVMTRYITNKEYKRAQRLFSNYIKLGYLTVFILGTICIILSEEMISFMYGEKYLIGKTIFILYMIVDIVKFANVSLVLSATGKTRILMIISISSLVANLFLNIIFYNIFGFIGPALATVMVTLGTTFIIGQVSCKILKSSFLKLIINKDFGVFIIQLLVGATIIYFIREFLVYLSLNRYIILFTLGGIFCSGMLLINLKKIKNVFMELNKIR